MKKILVVLFFLGLAVTTASAGMFDNLDTVNQQTFDTVHKGSGLGLKLIIAFLPVLLFVVAPIGTWVYYNRKTEQDKEDKFKVYLYTGLSTIVGFIAGMILIYVIGMGVFIKHGGGDKSLEVMSEFWASGVEGSNYGSATSAGTGNSLLK